MKCKNSLFIKGLKKMMTEDFTLKRADNSEDESIKFKSKGKYYEPEIIKGFKTTKKFYKLNGTQNTQSYDNVIKHVVYTAYTENEINIGDVINNVIIREIEEIKDFNRVYGYILYLGDD